MAELKTAIDIHRAEKGAAPKSATEIHKAGYLIFDPRDAWGSEYILRDDGKGVRIYSPGKDLKDDGGGGDDVTSEPKAYSCSDYRKNCPLDFMGRPVKLLAMFSVILGLVLMFASGLALVRGQGKARNAI